MFNYDKLFLKTVINKNKKVQEIESYPYNAAFDTTIITKFFAASIAR